MLDKLFGIVIALTSAAGCASEHCDLELWKKSIWKIFMTGEIEFITNLSDVSTVGITYSPVTVSQKPSTKWYLMFSIRTAWSKTSQYSVAQFPKVVIFTFYQSKNETQILKIHRNQVPIWHSITQAAAIEIAVNNRIIIRHFDNTKLGSISANTLSEWNGQIAGRWFLYLQQWPAFESKHSRCIYSLPICMLLVSMTFNLVETTIITLSRKLMGKCVDLNWCKKIILPMIILTAIINCRNLGKYIFLFSHEDSNQQYMLTRISHTFFLILVNNNIILRLQKALTISIHTLVPT